MIATDMDSWDDLERSRTLEKAKTEFDNGQPPESAPGVTRKDLASYDNYFESTILKGKIERAIKQNDREYLTALLLEAGVQKIILGPQTYTQIAWYLHGKHKSGRKKAYESESKQKYSAKCYGIYQARMKVRHYQGYKNSNDLHNDMCKIFTISKRKFDDILSKHKYTKKTYYYKELLRLQFIGFDLTKKGIEDSEKGKKQLSPLDNNPSTFEYIYLPGLSFP